jgi:nicotinate-nucleotide pyrophosphorylase (carboxylating)
VILTFSLLDNNITVQKQIEDGQAVSRGEVIAIIRGPAKGILQGERTALNILQRMSGIATITSKFVQSVKGTSAKILDTRKTVPGNRLLDKWAVRLGGGYNHRFGLYDMMLIKENHITVAGSITEALNRAKSKNTGNLPIEIEVKNLEELREALELKPDRIMLDNMSLRDLTDAVTISKNQVPLEASGNINSENVGAVAKTGVDFISIGMLTHSVQALDISLILR